MSRSAGFRQGVLKENPVAVALLGLCPAAAVTGRVIDALWMSLGFVFVLVLTRLGQTILRAAENGNGSTHEGETPRLRHWAGLLALASCFTASFELILLAFVPVESSSLGIFILYFFITGFTSFFVS